MTWGKSLPGRQGRKNKFCWVLRGEVEEKEGGGGGQPRGLVPRLLHPPQSWGRGEVLNNWKSSGEISE